MIREAEHDRRRRIAADDASSEIARRATPCCFMEAIDSGVRSGVALGVTDGSRPTVRAYVIMS